MVHVTLYSILVNIDLWLSGNLFNIWGIRKILLGKVATGSQ